MKVIHHDIEIANRIYRMWNWVQKRNGPIEIIKIEERGLK
nr:MAG TPA: hypothetical protein [Bacteriophage sp.]